MALQPGDPRACAHPTTPPAPAGGSPISGADPIFATGIAGLIAHNSSALPLGAAAGAGFDEIFSIEPFETGYMYYVKSTGKIYVLSNTGVQLSTYQNSWNEGDPGGDLVAGPRPNVFQPRRGFGKVWRENAVVQQALGYAVADERGYTGRAQYFERGLMIDDPADSLVWVLNVVVNIWDNASR